MSDRNTAPRSIPAEFRFTLTVEEEASLQNLPSAETTTWKHWIPLVLWIVGLALFTVATVGMWNEPYGIITAVIAYAWLFQIVWTLIAQGIARRYARNTQPAWETRVRLDENGVTEERGVRTLLVSWRQVSRVRVAGGFLCCDRPGRSPIVIPCRCLGTEEDAEAFRLEIAAVKARWNGPERQVGLPTITGPKATYVSTGNEIARMHKRHWATQDGRRHSFLTVTAYALGMATLCYHFLNQVNIALPIPLWLLATAAIVTATSPTTSNHSNAIAAMKQVPGMLGPFCVALSPEKVEVTHNAGTALTEWSGVSSIGRDRGGLYLNFADGSVIAIPRTAFATPAEEDAFYQTARRYAEGDTEEAPPEEEVWPPAPRAGQ